MHVNIPNSTVIRISNSSLLECSPPSEEARVRFLPGQVSLGDGDDPGQVSSILNDVHISQGSPHQQDPGGWKHSFQVGEYLRYMIF